MAVIVLDVPSAMLVPAAFAGALAAALAVYALSWRGGIGRYRLVLVGIGIAALAEAGIGYLLTRVQLIEATTAYTWMVGSLYAASWKDVALLAVSLTILVPAALLLGHGLQALQLGDDAAAGLGVATERTRLALVVVAVGLAAVGVAVAGPIAFVAFIAPHLARRLARASGSGLLPASAAIGALLVVGADLVARRVVEPAELPVGIVTVLLGAPFFLWLLVRAIAWERPHDGRARHRAPADGPDRRRAAFHARPGPRLRRHDGRPRPDAGHPRRADDRPRGTQRLWQEHAAPWPRTAPAPAWRGRRPRWRGHPPAALARGGPASRPAAPEPRRSRRA